MDNKKTQPYIYMYPFSPKLPSHPSCHITLNRDSVGLNCLSILNIAVCTCRSQTPEEVILEVKFRLGKWGCESLMDRQYQSGKTKGFGYPGGAKALLELKSKRS